MALLGPHPALKVAAPKARWSTAGWATTGSITARSARPTRLFHRADQHRPARARRPPRGLGRLRELPRCGLGRGLGERTGFDQLPFWQRHVGASRLRRLLAGPGARQVLLAQNPSNVPTMWLQGLWDQEDMWGAIHSYQALVKAGHASNNFIVMGPWRHSQINRTGSELGPFQWNGDTAQQYPRRRADAAASNQYLKDGPPANLPAAADLQHRREPLGQDERLADRVRQGLRRAADADVSAARQASGAGASVADRRTAMSPIPPTRCRTCPGR